MVGKSYKVMKQRDYGIVQISNVKFWSLKRDRDYHGMLKNEYLSLD